MKNYIPKCGDMELWLISVAIHGDEEIENKIKKNGDGSYPVKFEIGGVELDFSKVAQRISNYVNIIAEDKAHTFLDKKYKSLIKEINDIQDRLYYQKEKFFKYEDE